MSNVVEFPIADHPITEGEIAELHSRAFRDLEGGSKSAISNGRLLTQDG
jgi:hypothetical protein